MPANYSWGLDFYIFPVSPQVSPGVPPQTKCQTRSIGRESIAWDPLESANRERAVVGPVSYLRQIRWAKDWPHLPLMRMARPIPMK